jgi:hypothetical protein
MEAEVMPSGVVAKRARKQVKNPDLLMRYLEDMVKKRTVRSVKYPSHQRLG